jgi:hypothetical protein
MALVKTDVSKKCITSIIPKHTAKKYFYRSALQLLATANMVLNSLIIFTLKMEAILSSETSALARATWRHIPEDNILHRLRVFKNRVLRKIFGPKWDELTEGWRDGCKIERMKDNIL